MKPDSLLKTWVEIDKRAVFANVKTFRSLLKPTASLFAVVKSNAYGHGLRVFSKIADRAGVDGFCVDSVPEGVALREERIKKSILVLGPTLPGLFGKARTGRITLSISSWNTLKTFAERKTGGVYHLKFDTGMHRQGFFVEDVPKIIRLVLSRPALRRGLSGLFTHFASAKDIAYPTYTLRQVKEFEVTRRLFQKAGFTNLVTHASATGGTVLYPKAHYDAVRVGMGLYGHWPSREAELQHSEVWGRGLALRPVLAWRARVSEVKMLRAGDFVGYDLSEKLRKPTQAAVVPVGYWHGLPRTLSSRGTVMVGGARGVILGRVSMDMIVVGFGPRVRIRPGDRATLIGVDRGEEISAEEFAERADSIHYEVLTRLNPLMERLAV